MKRTTGISRGLLTLFLAILFAALSSSCGGGGGGESGHGLPVTMTVTASAVSPSQIALSWTPATLVTDYRIYMNGAYSGTVYPSQGTSITVSGLNPSTRYCFVVYVYAFPIGATEQSNEACATTLPNSPPTAPSNLTAKGVSPAQVDLTWTASTDDYGVAGYKIYRNGTNITSVPGTSASDTGLDPGASHCYAVTAYDAQGYESAPSNQACATTPQDTIPPTPPAGLTAAFDSANGANPAIKLSWNASTDNGVVRGYKVYRDGVYLANTTVTSYSDTGLSASTQYCYTVSAYDAAGNESAQSSQACTTTSWTLTMVDDQVEVEWTAIAIDPSDTVHISYYDGRYTGSNQQVGNLKYATNASGSWSTRVIDNVGSTVYASTSIEVDPARVVHIGYYAFLGFELKHITNATGSWVPEIVDPNAGNVTTVSLALDSVGHLHMVYNPNGNVTYTTNASGVWTSEVIGNIGAVFGGVTTAAIAVDSLGKVHISYYDYANHALKCVNNVSGSWFTETVDSGSDVGTHTAIAVDAAGKAGISYYDATNGDLKYATNASGAWIAQTVDSLGDVGRSTSIVMDFAGKVHISYTDVTDHRLKYATNVSGVWKAFMLDGASYVGDVYLSPSGYTAIAIDSLGKVHIAYSGDQHLKYATNR